MKSRIVFLAPHGSEPRFGAKRVDSKRWQTLLGRACKVRGEVYLRDGAIQESDLDQQGAFEVPLDRRSWHLLMLDEADNVSSTLRITMLPIDTGRRRGSLPHVGDSIGRAATDPLTSRLEMERYLSMLGLAYGAERTHFFVVGGWATVPKLAPSGAGAELALSVWAFTRYTEAAGAVCVASERHDAHGQLVRTGAVPIRAVNDQDMYYDPAYDCRVGILGFQVFRERRSLRRIVDQLTRRICDCEVVVNSPN